MLHNNEPLFDQLVLRASDSLEIEPGVVEKDYYVTLFLKLLSQKQENIIFKGGTSLSKCYKLIKRFSEDLDLNIECDGRPTQGQRRALKGHILEVIDAIGMELSNQEDIRSRRDFNRYVVDYPSQLTASYLKPQLIVETAVFIRAYPSQRMPASSYIYDYLKKANREDIIRQYELDPFEIAVQTAERTFIDKIFAVCDYYLGDRVLEHSRHIYDIYKLSSVVNFDSQLKELFQSVLEERRSHESTCLSAQEGIILSKVLQEIVDNGVYRADYEKITSELLFESVDYKTAIQALQAVIDSNLFD